MNIVFAGSITSSQQFGKINWNSCTMTQTEIRIGWATNCNGPFSPVWLRLNMAETTSIQQNREKIIFAREYLRNTNVCVPLLRKKIQIHNGSYDISVRCWICLLWLDFSNILLLQNVCLMLKANINCSWDTFSECQFVAGLNCRLFCLPWRKIQ